MFGFYEAMLMKTSFSAFDQYVNFWIKVSTRILREACTGILVQTANSIQAARVFFPWWPFSGHVISCILPATNSQSWQSISVEWVNSIEAAFQLAAFQCSDQWPPELHSLLLIAEAKTWSASEIFLIGDQKMELSLDFFYFFQLWPIETLLCPVYIIHPKTVWAFTY